MSSSKKIVNGLARRLSENIRGKLLAQAFVVLRRDGLITRVASIDGKPVQQANLDNNVVNGFVKRSWTN